MYQSNIFPKNSLSQDPNLRGSSPLVEQSIDFSGSLTAGELVVDNVSTVLDINELIGAVVYSKSNAAGLVLSATVEAGSASGIKLTIVASDNTSTAAVAGTAMVLGRITPTNV